jgi:hypothetical protein
MDEKEWETSTNPREMFNWLNTLPNISDRKLRMFACGCCILAKASLERVEKHEKNGFWTFDGEGWSDYEWALRWTLSNSNLVKDGPKANLLRCVFGYPHKVLPEQKINFPSIKEIAKAIYNDRKWSELGILADALEETEVGTELMIEHLRKSSLHTRGCWVLDWILNYG